jgi:hypothetical protein
MVAVQRIHHQTRSVLVGGAGIAGISTASLRQECRIDVIEADDNTDGVLVTSCRGNAGWLAPRPSTTYRRCCAIGRCPRRTRLPRPSEASAPIVTR